MAPGDADAGALAMPFERFRTECGGAAGVVTTVPFTHATPVAFAGHNHHAWRIPALNVTRLSPNCIFSERRV